MRISLLILERGDMHKTRDVQSRSLTTTGHCGFFHWEAFSVPDFYPLPGYSPLLISLQGVFEMVLCSSGMAY